MNQRKEKRIQKQFGVSHENDDNDNDADTNESNANDDENITPQIVHKKKTSRNDHESSEEVASGSGKEDRQAIAEKKRAKKLEIEKKRKLKEEKRKENKRQRSE